MVFLADHVRGHAVVAQGLGLHDALHVGGPTVLGGGQHAWGVGHPGRDDDLLDLVAQDLTGK